MEDALPAHRIQITRIAIACAVAVAVLPIRSAIWNLAIRNLEPGTTASVVIQHQDAAESLNKRCLWIR